ncbi:hypothetical protein [Sulfurospirillum sp. 1612]|uniref:hypothetical protein n=1 Tax=Sulfurospirillum sp. 1612 TaxID=3094835 RepID=UPI002F92FB8A
MQTENYIYFFTSCGFFIGLMFSLLNFSGPWDILLYSGAITLFFYLFIHIVVINFMDLSKLNNLMFNKKEHEEISEYFIKELDFRESKLDAILSDIEKMNRAYKVEKEYHNSVEKDGESHKQAA